MSSQKICLFLLRVAEFFFYEWDLFFEENCAYNDSTFLQSDVKKVLKDIRISNMNKLFKNIFTGMQFYRKKDNKKLKWVQLDSSPEPLSS